jgi:hypothetical protein
MAFTVSTICRQCGKGFTKGPFQGDPVELYYGSDGLKLTQLTCPNCGQQLSYPGKQLVIHTD